MVVYVEESENHLFFLTLSLNSGKRQSRGRRGVSLNYSKKEKRFYFVIYRSRRTR